MGAYLDDPRNGGLLIHLNGELVPREKALVSVFDSGYVLGDGVWEGIRIYNGRPAFLAEHLDRLYEGARMLDLDIGVTPEEMTGRIEETSERNELTTGAHLRLMVTRGEKSVPFQDPALCITPPTVVIVPQYMVSDPAVQSKGIRLATVAIRRGRPDVQDPKLNSHSKLNCVLACIQAKKVGASEALMLDPHGFVSTCNSTHFFVVRRGEVWTSTGKYCLGGITRGTVVRLCRENDIPVFEKDFSLTDVYGSEEAFCTGTLAGLVPVRDIDGRSFDGSLPGPMTTRLQGLYRELIEKQCGKLE